MILNGKKLKALIKKIQKECGTSEIRRTRTEVTEADHDSSKELFNEMKKKPHS